MSRFRHSKENFVLHQNAQSSLICHFSYLLIWQRNFAVAILIALGKPEVAGGGVVKALEGKRVLRVGVVDGKGGLIHERVLVPALSLPDDPAHTDTPVGVAVDPDAESIERDGSGEFISMQCTQGLTHE